jgi:predicted membrane-bound spermidine synthase
VCLEERSTDLGPGLPDGIFSNQKSQFGQILEGLGMEKTGILYGYLEYIAAIWYILWLFGNLVTVRYIFSPVLVYCVEKNLATLAWTSGFLFKAEPDQLCMASLLENLFLLK